MHHCGASLSFLSAPRGLIGIMLDPVRVSLVITTFENPRSLELVLAGVARQSRPADEVIVTDDGSGPATRDVVEAFAHGQAHAVRHIWHEHRGFRKCAILNRAVAVATGDYLIFLDGDCIPLAGFVATHVRASSRGNSCLLSPMIRRHASFSTGRTKKSFGGSFGELPRSML